MWDDLLIGLVEKHPMLYDKANDNFRNVNIKKEKWNEICAIINHAYSINLAVEECEQRWKQLREMFARHHKKHTSLNLSGPNQGKEWSWYHRLSFLTTHIMQRVPKPCSVMAATSSSPHHENFIKREEENGLHFLCYKSPEQPSTSVTLPLVGASPPYHSITNKFQQNPIQPTNCSISSTNVPPIKRKTPYRPSPKTIKKKKSAVGSKQNCNSVCSKNCCKVITEAVAAMSGCIKSVEEMDIGLQCIKEAWNKVPPGKKHQCLAELLNTLVKFSPRNTIN